MFIAGPSGNLEARLDLAPGPQQKTAVLCHPHPQYGGSMYDGVLDLVSDVLLARGVHCLRFNFRGVGASEGSFDQGLGEVDDLLACAQWAAEQHSEDSLWLAGYSFGSSVVWRSLPQLQVEQAILIAPPVGMMSFPSQDSATNVVGFAGDQDDFVKPAAFKELLGDNGHIITGADHFFSGYYADLRTALTSALK